MGSLRILLENAREGRGEGQEPLERLGTAATGEEVDDCEAPNSAEMFLTVFFLAVAAVPCRGGMSVGDGGPTFFLGREDFRLLGDFQETADEETFLGCKPSLQGEVEPGRVDFSGCEGDRDVGRKALEGQSDGTCDGRGVGGGGNP